MNIKNLVLSVEQVEKLNGLNVKVDTLSAFVWVCYEYRLKGDNPNSKPRTLWELQPNDRPIAKKANKQIVKIVPTYTTEELLQLIPHELITDDGNYFDLIIDFKQKSMGFIGCQPTTSNETWLNAAFELICALVSNKYLVEHSESVKQIFIKHCFTK